jgi:hypothetical protein
MDYGFCRLELKLKFFWPHNLVNLINKGVRHSALLFQNHTQSDSINARFLNFSFDNNKKGSYQAFRGMKCFSN